MCVHIWPYNICNKNLGQGVFVFVQCLFLHSLVALFILIRIYIIFANITVITVNISVTIICVRYIYFYQPHYPPYYSYYLTSYFYYNSSHVMLFTLYFLIYFLKFLLLFFHFFKPLLIPAHLHPFLVVTVYCDKGRIQISGIIYPILQV